MPHGLEHPVAIGLMAFAEMFEQPLGAKLLIVLSKDLGEAIGIEEEPRAFGKRNRLGGIPDAGENAEGRSAGFNHAHGAAAFNHEAGIVAGVHHIDAVLDRIELQKNSGDIAAASLRSFIPVLLADESGKVAEGCSGI